jgi:hypothetical protein
MYPRTDQQLGEVSDGASSNVETGTANNPPSLDAKEDISNATGGRFKAHDTHVAESLLPKHSERRSAVGSSVFVGNTKNA